MMIITDYCFDDTDDDADDDDDDDDDDEEDDDFEEDHVAEEDRSQDRDTHFVGACAVKMRIKMSQVPPFTDVFGHEKMSVPQTATRTCARLRSLKICQDSRFYKDPCIQKFTGQMPQTRTATHTLCQPAQSKCTRTNHKSLRATSYHVREFAGKMPQAKTAQQHFDPAAMHSDMSQGPF